MKFFNRNHHHHSQNDESHHRHCKTNHSGKPTKHQRHHTTNKKNYNRSQTSGASKNVIDQLMHVRLRETYEDMENCLICSQKHEIGHVVTTLPCGHMYHSNCAMIWLKQCCTCPICRHELTSDDDNSDHHDPVPEHLHEATVMMDGYLEAFKRTEPLEHDKLSLVARVLRLQQEENLR